MITRERVGPPVLNLLPDWMEFLDPPCDDLENEIRITQLGDLDLPDEPVAPAPTLPLREVRVTQALQAPYGTRVCDSDAVLALPDWQEEE